MKVAIAYLTKDRVELTRQTVQPFDTSKFDLHWIDGSASPLDLMGASWNDHLTITAMHRDIRGGADAAIVFALTKMLAYPANYTHVGLCENDVLLADGWFERAIALFEKGAADGLDVGAVSARAYADRVLIQRDGYAVMHNLGAGHVIFSRKAAELVLANYRTGWWPDNRAIFSQLSGIDIGRYACFRGNTQWTTADWHFDAALAQHGLASCALTPSAVEMIGQTPSLEEQGLELVTDLGSCGSESDVAFVTFVGRTASIRSGAWKPTTIKPVHEFQGTKTIFPQQIPMTRDDNWRLKWCQGFGPFAYRADDKAEMAFKVFGPASLLISGGPKGAKVTIEDRTSGYEVSPDLPAIEQRIAQIHIPGEMSLREIRLTCAPGAVFHGIQTSEAQPSTSDKFDYHSLPPV